MAKTTVKVSDRVWVHTGESSRVVVDPSDVYYLESDSGDTWVRLRGKKRLRDIRKLGQVAAAFAAHGFVRVHKAYAVNGRRVVELRQRTGSREWELVLQRPVGKVLPIGRSYWRGVRAAYGDV